MEFSISKVYETRAGVSVTLTSPGEEEINLLFKPSFWLEENLGVGDTVDEERLEALEKTAEVCKAVARAESMLSQSDYSRQRLITRLLHYHLEKSACEAAADYMIENGYINEEEQTKRITKFYCQRKHWGKKRIAAELMGRGYDRRVIFKALDTVSDEEYYASLQKLIEEKYSVPTDDRKERDHRIAAIARLGFSVSDIIRALDEAEKLYLSAMEDFDND